MTFEQMRAGLIKLGSYPDQTPCLRHRPFDLVELLKRQRAPVSERQARRLPGLIARNVREIERCKQVGRYEPKSRKRDVA